MKEIIFLLLLCICISSLPNQTPVIGIFTQSSSSDEPKGFNLRSVEEVASNYSYIATSYVKYIQMSGAQVIPIFGFSNKSYFDEILPKINGVLFPGGDQDININNIWTQNANYILKYAQQQNNNGNPFPVWGTCLGMQLLAYLTSGFDANAISPVRGEVAVRNTIQIQQQNTLFNDLSPQLRKRLEFGEGILYFNHHYAVTKSYYDRRAQLKSYWNVQAFTTTSYSEEFLSVFKAKSYPFYGVQFHPQKNLFQWKVYADRSSYGAQIVQILSNKFVEIARKGKNQFSSFDQFSRRSIYNYKAVNSKMSFLQVYLFQQKNGFGNEEQKRVMQSFQTKQ